VTHPKALRATQCREGWHLEDEPDLTPAAADETQEFCLILRAEAQLRRDVAAVKGEDTSDYDQLIDELDMEITGAGIPGHRHYPPQQRHWQPAGPPVAVHPPPPGRRPAARPEDSSPHGRQGVHRAGRQAVPAVDVHHLDL